MITIESLVEQGANVKLEVTPADLKMFAESIVQRTIMAQQEELDAEMQRCNLQIFLCLFLEKLNMPQNTPVTKAS